MTQEAKTFELRLEFAEEQFRESPFLKTELTDWLIANGVESFVEGAIDDLDIDHRYDQQTEDYFEELGGEKTPVSIFDYSKEYLSDIEARVLARFPKIRSSMMSMDSEVWKEGWKESFKPIYSKKCVVYPPWDLPSDAGERFLVEVEPGMAFGTGQHATTQICLETIEGLDELDALRDSDGRGLEPKRASFLDVGTGTGVLALAAGKLGFTPIVATDIDHSAVKACKENAVQNSVEIDCMQGSVPFLDDQGRAQRRFKVVVANILFVVLSKIIGDLAQATEEGGVLILSGVLLEQEEEMIRLAQSERLSLVKKSEKLGWSCLVLKKMRD